MTTELEFIKLNDFLSGIDTIRFEITLENIEEFNDVFGGDTVRRLWFEPKDKTIFNNTTYGPNVTIVNDGEEYLFKINDDTLLVRSFSINGTELTFTIVDNRWVQITNCSTIAYAEYKHGDSIYMTVPVSTASYGTLMSPVVNAMWTIGISDIEIIKP